MSKTAQRLRYNPSTSNTIDWNDTLGRFVDTIISLSRIGQITVPKVFVFGKRNPNANGDVFLKTIELLTFIHITD